MCPSGKDLAELKAWSGYALDAVVVGGLVYGSVFAVRPQPHFLARTLVAAATLGAAVRIALHARRPAPAAPGPATISPLVAIVAHEIRAPLAAIRGAVALLDEHQAALEPVRRSELFGVALEATKQLGHLADDLLLISRISAGRLRVERILIDVVAVVYEAANAEIWHTVSVVEQSGVPYVYGDAMRVRQVVTNLLSNAVANAIESSIVLVSITTQADSVRVTIYNEGRGIPPEEQSRLFLPFASLGERRVDSTGLGLYIAKELVNAMDGTIGFDTQPGRNAAFWFSLKSEPGG